MDPRNIFNMGDPPMIMTFGETMSSILLNGSYSDMEIECEDFTFKLHRNIVCPQSGFFKAAMDGGFAESATKRIKLVEDDLDTIERVISFLYLQRYEEEGHVIDLGVKSDIPAESNPDLSSEVMSSKAELKSALKPNVFNDICVYIAADKFLIDSLKLFVAAKLEPWLEAKWDSAIFPKVVEHILRSTTAHDAVLVPVIVKIMAQHTDDLMKKKAIRKLLCEFGDLGSLILTRLVERNCITVGWPE